MPHSYIIKKTAHNALKNNWIKSITVSLILLVTVMFSTFFQELVFQIISAANLTTIGIFNAESVINTVSVAIELLLILCFVFPLLLGIFRYFWQLTDYSEVNVSEIFYYFSSKKLYKRAVKTFLHLFVRIFLIFLVCLSPCIIIKTLTSVSFYSFVGISVPASLISVDFINNWALFFGIVVGVIVSSYYFLVPAIITANEQTEVLKAFKLSRKVTAGNIGHFIKFVLSFAGWLLLSLLAFPIIFTLPYFLASYAEFSRTVIKINNEKSQTTEYNGF